MSQKMFRVTVVRFQTAIKSSLGRSTASSIMVCCTPDTQQSDRPTRINKLVN